MTLPARGCVFGPAVLLFAAVLLDPNPGLLAAPAALEGQEGRLSVERLHASPSLAGRLPDGLAWLPDSKRLSFLRR
jgi:hypothetical protein